MMVVSITLFFHVACLVCATATATATATTTATTTKATSGLYGFTWPGVLFKINPSTFELDMVVNLSSPVYAHTAVNNKKGIIYCMGRFSDTTKVDILGIKLDDGSVVSTARIPFDAMDNQVYLNIDEKNGELVIVGPIFYGSPFDIFGMMRVDPSSANSTRLLPGFNLNLTWTDQLASAYDSKNNIQYIAAVENDIIGISETLIALDANTGKVINRYKEPTLSRYQGIQFDPKTDSIFGIYVSVERQTHFFSWSAAKGIRSLSIVPGIAAYTGSTIDVEGRIYYMFYLTGNYPDNHLNLLTINIDSGKILASSPDCPGDFDTGCPESMAFYTQENN